MNIEIHDINTWPVKAVSILSENLNLLANHAAKDREYIFAPWDEKINFVNEYAYERNLILKELDNILKGYSLVGYHCARLLDYEIAEIQSIGMEASNNFLQRKIAQAVTQKVFSFDFASYLLSKKLHVQQGTRRGKLYFVCGKSELQHEDVISKFFRCWGGEAIFNLHENDNFSWPILSTLGKPCIIKTALIPEKLVLLPNISERLETSFLQTKGVSTSDSAGFDTLIRGGLLPPTQILKIIDINDPEFPTLTNYKSWDRKLSKGKTHDMA